MTKVAVIYYSAPGTTFKIAKAVEAGAAGAGAVVRLLKVRELAPDEAMRLPQDRQVLLRPGHAPALVGKLRHYGDAEFAGLADG